MMLANNSIINLNMNKMNLTLKPNCSTYDPCGAFGYCVDNDKNEWTCTCRFWWTGTTCDALTNSGEQLVILASINVFLLIIYYSLTLYFWLKKRRNKPPKPEITTSPVSILTHRSYTRMTTNTRSSRRILPCLIALGTLILGTVSLAIKYSILKPMHEEIVNKYKHNQSLFYYRPSACNTIYPQPDFNIITFPIACFLIFMFIITTKRDSTNGNSFLWGYVAIPVPLDFFAHIKRTFAGVIFAIVADDLTNIALQLVSGSGTNILGEGIILTYLSQILKVLFIGFRCYPTLAAVYINSRLSLICAILYSWLDFYITISFKGVCRNDYYATDENYNKTDKIATILYFKYYGTGSYLIFIQLLTELPRCIFMSYICIQLPVLLYKRIQHDKRMKKKITQEQRSLLYSSVPNSFEWKYVRNLLGLNDQEVSAHPIKRLLTYVYKWRDDFRYSSRIVCVYASIFFLLFFLTMQACVLVPPYLTDYDEKPDNLFKSFAVRNTVSDSSVLNFIRPYFISIFLALIIIIIQLFVLLITIRRNLLQVFRGDFTEIPRRQQSQNVSYADANIHFAGYLIGYVLWGYVLIAAFFIIITFAFTFVLLFGWKGVLETIAKIIIPPVLFAIFQNYLNKILGEFVFLQQRGKVFSLKNRRLLMLFLYFNFFLDAFLGLVSSIIRLLKSMIGGIFYMCRLDYSTLGRKLESFDPGFNAYCGFIHMESAHRHPVVLYFSSLLIHEQLYGAKETRRSKARQRWDLAIFLVKNPTLIYRRKQFVLEEQNSEARISFIGRKLVKQMSVQE